MMEGKSRECSGSESISLGKAGPFGVRVSEMLSVPLTADATYLFRRAEREASRIALALYPHAID